MRLLLAVLLAFFCVLPVIAETPNASVLTVNRHQSLPGSRKILPGNNLFATDGGAQGDYGLNPFAISTATGNTTLLSTSSTSQYGSASGGAFSYTLSAASVSANKLFCVKKTDSSTNAITITRAGGDTIEGGTSIILGVQNDCVWLHCDSSSTWKIIDRYYGLNSGKISLSAFSGDEADLQASNLVSTSLTAPVISSVTNTGTPGSTTVGYRVVAYRLDNSRVSLASAEVTTATSNATLTGSNYNVVSWGAVTGADGYLVYRTNYPVSTTTGYVYGGLLTDTASTSFNDIGATALGGSSAPALTHLTGSNVGVCQFGINSGGVTIDAGLARNAAAVIEVNGGNGGQLGTILSDKVLLRTLTAPIAMNIGSAGSANSGSWGYKVVAVYPDGSKSAASTQFTNTSNLSAATLTGSDLNRISFTPVYGASSYEIYRTQVRTSPATTGKIGTVAAAGPLFLADTGLAGDGNPAPSVATSGRILWETDNVGDIGASGANRPRNLYLGNDATIGGALNVTGTSTLGVLNPTSIGAFTLSGLVTPSAAETHDLGTANVGLRDIYLGGTGGFTTKITKTTPSADRTFTLPNANSVAVIGDSGAANNYISAIDPSTGVITKSQPAMSGISGTASPGQGGTGSTGVPTNGQIPIGNGTIYTPATITQAGGVTVTNGSASITVSTKKFANVRKNATTTRASTSTETADPDFSIPVGANESWNFTADFMVSSASTAPDFKCCLAGPAGSTVSWNAWSNDTTNTITKVAATAGGTTAAFQVPNGTLIVHLTGTISGTYSAGNVTINWAQNTLNAANTVMEAAGTMCGYQQ